MWQSVHRMAISWIARSILLAGALLVGHAAAQPSYFLDFYTNEVPPGWAITPTRSGTNYGIADGRFFAGSFDSSSHLSTQTDLSSSTESFEFRWDGNITHPKGGWGAQAAVQFGPQGTDRYMTRWTTVSWDSRVQIELASPTSYLSFWLDLSEGDYRFISLFAPNQITFAGSLGGTEQFRVQLSTSVNFPNVDTIELYTFQNGGPTVWMDNIWIQATSVPELPPYALLAIGLAALTRIRNAKRTPTTAVDA